MFHVSVPHHGEGPSYLTPTALSNKIMFTVVGRRLYQGFGVSGIHSFLEKLVH